MGFVRGGLLIVIGFVFFVLVLGTNLFLTLSWSLEYETISSELSSVILEVVEEETNFTEIVEENLPIMEIYCENNSDYVFDAEGQVFSVSCGAVMQGSDEVIEESIENFADEIYYQEYDCAFWECFQISDKPFVLVSEYAKNYWGSKFYLCLIFSIVLFVVGLFVAEKRSSWLITSGVLIVVSSLPFIKIDWLASLLGDILYGVFSVFFTKAYSVFVRVVVLGIFIFAIGIAMKFFNIGMKISNLFSKEKKFSNDEVEEIVKKKTSKKK